MITAREQHKTAPAPFFWYLCTPATHEAEDAREAGSKGRPVRVMIRVVAVV